MELSPIVMFVIEKSKLDNLLKIPKINKTASKVKSSTCELTLTDNMAKFVGRGVHFLIPVSSSGTAKATFELSTFVKLIKTYDKDQLKIEIHPGYIKVENFKVPAFSTFMEDDKILRSIDLPINFSDFDLLVISKDDRYTKEELDFNKLTPMITEAKSKLEEALKTSDKQLKRFGITSEDLQNLLEVKIQRKLRLRKVNKKPISRTDEGFNSEALHIAVRLVDRYIKAGKYKFSDIIEGLYNKEGEELFRAIKGAYGAYFVGEATDEEADQMDVTVRKYSFKEMLKKFDEKSQNRNA